MPNLLRYWRPVILVVSFALVSITSYAMPSKQENISYEAYTEEQIRVLIPEQIGEWRMIDNSNIVQPKDDESDDSVSVYISYANLQGMVITLAVAHGGGQGDAVRLHRPEICYEAQGFETKARHVDAQSYGATEIPVIYMAAESNLREDFIAYWMRVGNGYANGQASQQFSFMFDRDQGVQDSTLVRASIRMSEGMDAKLILNEFLHDFVTALPEEASGVLFAV